MHSLEEALEFPVADDGRNNTPRRPACSQDGADAYLGATDAAIQNGDAI
jgi:hypothetical protein